MKIQFTLPATVAHWKEETPEEGWEEAHYSRSWTLRVGASGFGVLIGWVDLYKDEHAPEEHRGAPYRWCMASLLERAEPAGFTATLEEAREEIFKRLGTVELL